MNGDHEGLIVDSNANSPGYAVRRREMVQLGVCEPHFDDFGRISDQYLQFEVSYTQIR